MNFDAVAFVREHGVVLASARGPVPNIAEAVAGEAIRGSWWSHPRGKSIFAALRAAEESDEVLTCQLVGGRKTFVHARLWPALVRAADRFPRERLARSREVHTAGGKHVREDMPFPAWVPEDVAASAQGLSLEDALAALGAWTRDPR